MCVLKVDILIDICPAPCLDLYVDRHLYDGVQLPQILRWP